MYFWKIEELKQQLVARPLTDREVLPYLVIFMAVTTAIPLNPVGPLNSWDYVGGIAAMTVAVLGTIYAYRCNGGSMGSHFLQRYFAIGWVVAIRLSAVIVPAAVALLVLFDAPAETATWYTAAFLLTVELIYYGRLAHHLRSVARASIGSAS